MSIKIDVEKHLSIDNEKLVSLKILGMLSKGSLPKVYTDTFPSVWRINGSLYVHTDNQVRQDQYRIEITPNNTVVSEYLIGFDMPLERAEYLIEQIRIGGERLHKIMSEHRKNAALYDGETTVEV